MPTQPNEKQDFTNQVLSPSILNSQGLKSGTDAERIASTPVQGWKWITTDTANFYYYTGTAWIQLGGVPTGTVVPYAGTRANTPTGYLYCDGSAVSRTTYATLFAIIGIQFGAGDGLTTFNLPDMRGKFPRCAPALTDSGGIGGEDTHVLTVTEMPVHAHGLTDPGHTHTVPGSSGGGAGIILGPVASSNNVNVNTSSVTTGITMANAGGGAAHENKPPFVNFVGIIKT